MKQHDSHWDNRYDRSCPGWTDTEEDIEKLAQMLTKWARLAQLQTLEKQQLRLYAHPSVLMHLRTHIEPDFRSYTPPFDIGLPFPFRGEGSIEVITDEQLPEGSWRFEIARGSM